MAAVGGKLGGVGAAAGVLVLRRWLTMSRGAADERGIFFNVFRNLCRGPRLALDKPLPSA